MTAEEAAAELAEDQDLALPPLFVQTLMERLETLQADPEAPVPNSDLPQLDFPSRQRAGGDGAPETETVHRAAWVPAESARDPESAAASATAWIIRRANTLELPAVVLSPDRKTEASARAFERLRGKDMRITPLARGGVAPGTGPVLAYLPQAGELELAARLAADGPLCVVEAPDFPVSGWARDANALNLDRGEVTDAYPAEVHRRLEQLIGCGHDGWAPVADAEQARQVLKDLLQEDFADLAALRAYAAGREFPTAAVNRLDELAGEVGFDRP
ncbi:hypothetical protein [Glycomyces xiaoerkulensis]|uniref:hypothetical protein n=1 Tax=Glycomyces xiaoerkulensis TaxID=2038139 RepID=UPI000C259475|nr:hypothetical protein [Glycomyces xiaoerkulensis]